MAIEVAVTQFAASTGGGNQTILAPGFTAAPKAVMFIWTNNTANASVSIQASWGWGAADGTAQWGVGVRSRDARATTEAGSYQSSSLCITLMSPLSDTLRAGGAFSAWYSSDPDYGVTINWSTTPVAAYLITAIFFGGSDLSVDAHSTALSAQDTEVNVTAPGFEPDLLLLGSIGSTTLDSGLSAATISTGVVVNDGSATQRCHLWCTEHSADPSNVAATLETDRCAGDMAAGGSINWTAEVTHAGFDASGYSIYSRGGASGGDYVHCLALKFGGVATAELATVNSPTSTGSTEYSPFSGTPSLMLCWPTTLTAIDTVRTDGEAGTLALCAWDATRQYSNCVTEEDNVGTSNTSGLIDDQALLIIEHDQTDAFTATLTSFDSDGFTLNFSATLGTACKWIALGIVPGAPPATSIPRIMHHRRMMGVS